MVVDLLAVVRLLCTLWPIHLSDVFECGAEVFIKYVGVVVPTNKVIVYFARVMDKVLGVAVGFPEAIYLADDCSLC